jgi:hypothetical protein
MERVMGYQPRTDRRCSGCSRFPDFTGRDMLHWRSCVPKRDWPTFAVQADAGRTIDCDASLGVLCEDCGFVAASAFGLRAHQRKHKAVTA